MKEIKLPKITFWRAVLVIIWTLGLYATFIRYTKGLGAATNLSDQFPWGIWIGFDILVGVGLAAGGFVITAIVYIFNIKGFKAISRPTVLTAFLGYLLVIGALLFDLGLPYNVWHPIIMWNPHSVMFEVGWCVMLYTTVLLLEFSPLVLERFGFKKPLAFMRKIILPLVILGVLFSTLHQSSLGTLYVIVPDKLHPLWYTGLLPLLFFISAIGGGLAMVIFESYTSARAFGKELEFPVLAQLSRILVVVLTLLLFIRYKTLVANNAMQYIFDGSKESIYFIIEILIGILIPITLFLIPKIRNNRAGLFLGSIFVLLGFIMNRLNVSITGMAGSSGVNYFPTWMEIAITASIVSAGFVIFRYASKYLPVFPEKVFTPGKVQAPLISAGRSGSRVIWVLGFLLLLVSVGLALEFSKISKPAILPEEQNDVINDITADLKLPAQIKFEKGEDSPGLVTFTHETHVDPDTPNCVNCHESMFKIKPEKAGTLGSVNMEKFYENEQCGTCHNGNDSFSVEECEICHLEE